MFHNSRDSRIVVKIGNTARRVRLPRARARLNVVPRFFEVHLPGHLSHSHRRHVQFPPAIEVDVMPHLPHEGHDIRATRPQRGGSRQTLTGKLNVSNYCAGIGSSPRSTHPAGYRNFVDSNNGSNGRRRHRRSAPPAFGSVFRSLANHLRVALHRFMCHRGRGFQPSPIQSCKQNIPKRSDECAPSMFTYPVYRNNIHGQRVN